MGNEIATTQRIRVKGMTNFRNRGRILISRKSKTTENANVTIIHATKMTVKRDVDSSIETAVDASFSRCEMRAFPLIV